MESSGCDLALLSVRIRFSFCILVTVVTETKPPTHYLSPLPELCALDSVSGYDTRNVEALVTGCKQKKPDMFASVGGWSKVVRRALADGKKPLRRGWLLLLKAYAAHKPQKYGGASFWRWALLPPAFDSVPRRPVTPAIRRDLNTS